LPYDSPEAIHNSGNARAVYNNTLYAGEKGGGRKKFIMAGRAVFLPTGARAEGNY
jgi:hypothetical protein